MLQLPTTDRAALVVIGAAAWLIEAHDKMVYPDLLLYIEKKLESVEVPEEEPWRTLGNAYNDLLVSSQMEDAILEMRHAGVPAPTFDMEENLRDIAERRRTLSVAFARAIAPLI